MRLLELSTCVRMLIEAHAAWERSEKEQKKLLKEQQEALRAVEELHAKNSAQLSKAVRWLKAASIEKPEQEW